MKTPGFAAEATVYRSSAIYSACGIRIGISGLELGCITSQLIALSAPASIHTSRQQYSGMPFHDLPRALVYLQDCMSNCRAHCDPPCNNLAPISARVACHQACANSCQKGCSHVTTCGPCKGKRTCCSGFSCHSE